MTSTMHRRAPQPAPTAARTQEIAEDHEAALAALDELLDEIDDVLEENAIEVTRRFVQRGGE